MDPEGATRWRVAQLAVEWLFPDSTFESFKKWEERGFGSGSRSAVAGTDVADVPNEDNLGFNFPSKPSELRLISDEALATTYRRMAYANRYPFDRMVEQELSIRLAAALVGFKRASDRASAVLIGLTVVLVVLTAVLVWLTTRL